MSRAEFLKAVREAGTIYVWGRFYLISAPDEPDHFDSGVVPVTKAAARMIARDLDPELRINARMSSAGMLEIGG